QSVFVSGESAWTVLARYAHPPQGVPASFMRGHVTTLVRLEPGAAPLPVRRALMELSPQLPDWHATEALDMIRIDTLRTDPAYNPSITYSNVMLSALGFLILFIAGMNFVNLMTARSGARMLEIGVRKLAGASRANLALQFLGETFLYVILAVLVAVAMTELLLPYVNALSFGSVEFEYWQDPALLAGLLAGSLLFALLAG